MPPLVSQDASVWGQLHARALAFMRCHALPCAWHIDVDPEQALPNEAMAAALLEVFDEMLNNVAQHAQASHVDIHVRAQDRDVALLVRDNGRGAPPSAFDVPTRCGIRRMREQARTLGGWLDIHSHIGQGTTCVLTVPLHPYRSAGMVITAER